jgi:peptidoglycan glycosyltransferase
VGGGSAVPSPETNIQHLNRLILAAFMLVALSLVFWSVLRAEAILERDDNPRQVEAALRIQRGRILDRNGAVLAETIGPPDDLRRHYPETGIGPAVGYYSFRHGADGVEESFGPALRGDDESFWRELGRQALHAPRRGQDVRLTLDAQWQTAAEELLRDHQGGLALFSLSPEGEAEVLALSSHPGYDPNQLRETFEALAADENAPLLNRITQGQYQPGLLLQPFILATAVEDGLLAWDEAVEHPNRPVLVNDTAVYCASPAPENGTWEDVLHHRCPGPMLDLGETLTLPRLNAAFDRFGLTTPPQLPLNTETATYPPLADAAQTAIGQDNLIVTPLQIAAAWLTLLNDGRSPTLRLVTDVQDESGEWVPAGAETGTGTEAVSRQTAVAVLDALPQENGVTSFSTLVLSGPEGSSNSWYLGTVPSGDGQFAVVIVLEEQADLAVVEEMGGELLTAVAAETGSQE